ncbi:uncharacterized protein LOC144936417 [Lampetra fluviatilis]
MGLIPVHDSGRFEVLGLRGGQPCRASFHVLSPTSRTRADHAALEAKLRLCVATPPADSPLVSPLPSQTQPPTMSEEEVYEEEVEEQEGNVTASQTHGRGSVGTLGDTRLMPGWYQADARVHWSNLVLRP